MNVRYVIVVRDNSDHRYGVTQMQRSEKRGSVPVIQPVSWWVTEEQAQKEVKRLRNGGEPSWGVMGCQPVKTQCQRNRAAIGSDKA